MAKHLARWALRALVALLVLTFLGVATTLLVLHTDWGRDQIRQQIEAKLQPNFPAGARIGRVEGSVLGDFYLHDVVLADLDGRPAVRIDRIELNLQLLAFLRDEARFEKVIVEGGAVDLHQRDGDPPNLATMYTPSSDPMQFDVVIERLEVQAAAVTLERDGRVQHLDDFTVLARLKMKKDGALRGRTDVTARWRERATPLGFVADVAIDPAGVIDLATGKLTAGDVLVEAANLHIGRGNDVAGALHVTAPRGALAHLVPEAAVPEAAIELDAALLPIGKDGMQAVLRGRFGAATFLGALSGRRTETHLTVGGSIMVRDANARDALATLPATSVDSTTVVALHIDTRKGWHGVHGMIGVDGRGTVDALRFDQITAGVMIAGSEARLSAEARGDGETWLRTGGVITTTETTAGRIVDLRDGTLVAHSTSLERAAQGRVAVAGTVDVNLAISGRIVAPRGATPQFAVRGTLGGQRLRREDVRIRDLDVTLDLDGIPARPGGSARVSVRGARVGADAMPDIDASARGRMDGGFAVDVRADDRTRDVRGRISAVLTLPRRRDTVAAIDLGAYDVVAKSARVTGRGGRIVIQDDHIVVRDIRGATAGGTIAIDAVAPRRQPMAMTGVVTASNIDLARLRGVPGMSPTMRGSVDARVILERDHVRANLAFADDQIGNVSGLIDVALPRRPNDPAAWMALDRRAVRELQLDLRAVDLAEVSKTLQLEKPVHGRVDGTIRVGTGSPQASIRARGVLTEGMPERADIDLKLDLEHPTLTGIDVTATLRDLGTARATGSIRMPERIFDVAAWERLGVGAIESVHVRVDQLVIDQRLAMRAGAPELRGVVTADLSVGRGLAGVSGTVSARDLRAGGLVDPAAVTLYLDSDRGGLRAAMTASLCGATVVTANLSTPRDLVAMIAARRDLAAVPVTGKLAIAGLDLRRFGRSFGVRRVPNGTVRGTGTVTGTLGAPTGELALTVENFGARRPRRGGGGGALRGGIRQLAIAASYAGGAVHATVKGREDNGGTIDIVAEAQLDALDRAQAHVVAKQFQIRPLARLVPGALLGVSGKLDADLRVRGTDPAKATILGSLVLRDGTMPIDDTVGVLRDATAAITFEPAHVRARIDGKIESGTLSIEADAALDGLLPRRGTLVAKAKGLELILSSAPRVNGTLTAELDRDGDTWKITAAVRNASVTSRSTSGRELHPSGMPDDLVFASTAPGAPTPIPPVRKVKDFIGEPPSKPIVDITLRVYNVAVDVPQLRGDVGGRLDISIGNDGAVVDGKLEVLRGDVLVLERRWRLRRAIVLFDGGLDPRLDLQLERELPELTLLANIRGRASQPQLEFTSDPPTYTQGQLLAFAVSDTASSAGSETTDAAANLFASVASQAVVGVIAPILPVHFDLIAYEPASASSSRAFVFGRWITRRLLVLYRNRAEARADENVNEAEVEYWLGRRVLFEGVAGDRGILGADLLWTRRW